MAASLRNKPQQHSNLLFGDSYQKLLPALLAQTVASRRAVERASVIGWSDPVCGRELHPRESSAFSRRTVSLTMTLYDVLPCGDVALPRWLALELTILEKS
jgi:hypothetical protein